MVICETTWPIRRWKIRKYQINNGRGGEIEAGRPEKEISGSCKKKNERRIGNAGIRRWRPKFGNFFSWCFTASVPCRRIKLAPAAEIFKNNIRKSALGVGIKAGQECGGDSG